MVVALKGQNALHLEAVAGSLSLGSNLNANGKQADDVGGIGRIGGYDGASAGTSTGNGPGAPTESSEDGHGAAYGGHGSGAAQDYGDRALNDLLGGSSGGASTEGSGAGGGAISLKASAELIIEPNVLISVNGGDGGANSAAGTGGAVRLEATRIYNHGRIEARAGNGVTASGNSQNRGSSGGRVALIGSGDVKVGEVDVSGEWLSNEGSIFVGGAHLDTVLTVRDQEVVFDTKTGYFSVEGGAHGVGVITDHIYTDDYGQAWPYQVCTFSFGAVDIKGASLVKLRGDKSLQIKTVAGGDIYLGADFILDGGDADTDTGYGGRPVLNPWRGRSSEKLKGFGPGGPGTAGNWGIGANYEYGDEQISHLLAGSSGSSGKLFQGSGAGGGALAVHADGDLIIGDGVFISAQGGDGRADGIYDHAGGGSGGAIRLVGKNIDNRGLISVEGGNRGASGGRLVMASGGNISAGVISVANGSFKEIRPPQLSMPEKLHLSFRKAQSVKFRKTVTTRPNNLTAYWPMDEGTGVKAVDVAGTNDGSLVGGASWQDGKFGKAIRFDGQTDLSQRKLQVLCLESMVRNPEQSVLDFCRRWEPQKSAWVLWLWREVALLVKTGSGVYEILKTVVTRNCCLSIGAWIHSAYHNNDLRNRWAHFAHLFNGSEVVYMDGKLVVRWTREK